LGGCLTVVALFYKRERLLELEEIVDTEIKRQVDESPLNCLWLILPPGQVDTELLESLGSDVVEKLGAYGFPAEPFRMKIVTHPDGEKALGIQIRLAPNTFVSPEVTLDLR
jgi:hypothetical protein